MKFLIEVSPMFVPDPFEGTLQEALDAADKKIEYFTKDLRVLDENGNEVARRKWNLVGMKKDFYVPNGAIRFCDGYYGPWIMNTEN